MTNQTAFTPGPWVLDASHKTAVNSATKHIALVSYFGRGGEEDVLGAEHDANARLIASAPDLYEALKDLLAIAEMEGIVGDSTTLEAARAALSRATSPKE